MAIVGQGFGPAAELPLGASRDKSAPNRPIASLRAGQKAGGRAEAPPHSGKTSGIGLKPVEETRMENWVEFEAGAARFSLHSIPSEIADHIRISSPPRPREKNPVKLSFEVDDIASERRRLESLGVTIVQRPWGAYDGIDPEGNVFGIYSVP